ncbi:6477_t:CDS:2, partial [Dentiscutata erythropus]
GGKVRVLKMLEISPLMIPVVKDYYENDIFPIYNIKYRIELKRFERDLDCLLIKPMEAFHDKLHRYDSDILPFVNYSKEWHIFVEGGYGFYCVSEYFEFIKKGLLEYFPNFEISEK